MTFITQQMSKKLSYNFDKFDTFYILSAKIFVVTNESN